MTRRGKNQVGLLAVALALSCTIGSGDNTPISLGVLWFPQENPVYCVPASIQMWAIFDRMPVSQTAIANFVGTVPGIGTPALNVAPGVNRFTATRDAVLYDAFSGGPDYYSKQITSINNGRPFLGAFDLQHVVVVDGGNWHIDNNSGLYVWDDVLYHDPQSSAQLDHQKSGSAKVS
jgi:hypothetical protein